MSGPLPGPAGPAAPDAPRPVPAPPPVRPIPAPPSMRPVPAPRPVPPEPEAASGSGHPAVDAVIQAIANADSLPPADQIAQYEAAHRTLQEVLGTIDQT